MPNNRSTFAADDEYATFTIRKVVDDDDNTYTIKVHNDYGEVEDTVSLVIMSKFNIDSIHTEYLCT